MASASTKFRFGGTGDGFAVAIDRSVSLQVPSDEGRRDHEGLAILPNGHFLVSSEGTGVEPRVPPGISEFGPQGEFIRSLHVPDKFIPEPTGAATHGAGKNAGFESLTLSPDATHLYTATESALLQDVDPHAVPFEAAPRTRILEYVARAGRFEPGREFVYLLEPLDRPPFEPGAVNNGLVDLLALADHTLLALERAFIEDAGNKGRGASRIRVYRVSLERATNVSVLNSLRDHDGLVAVAKTLLLDLSKTPALSQDLAASLDNFEGITFGPPLPGGQQSIVIVSDDNFSVSQRTWFLQFAVEPKGPRRVATGKLSEARYSDGRIPPDSSALSRSRSRK